MSEHSALSPDLLDEFEDSLDIAIVGMAGRFPKARDVDEFWSNLKAGVCAVTRFDGTEAARGDAEPVTARDGTRLVRAGYLLEDGDKFDAAFFGFSPREAELMDPQHRVFLECAWEALENAGHDPDRYDGLIGVYAGAGHNTYLLRNIGAHRKVDETVSEKQIVIGNRPDFLTSRVSYKLGLEGPGVTVQSACSTSLVAVIQACQGLLSYQCDMALAGGVSLDGARADGYVYAQDSILSPDGYCRTFDARAQGTVGGDGAGIVVLKRLKDAVVDRDTIHAVVKGSALNNDGAGRAGFTAPSAVSQARVITSALANADIDPRTIRYVEAHGSATSLGDPIEVSGLTSAYHGVPTGHCALGAVKTNIGHLDSAAGVAGLIKAALAVQHGEIPPTLHFEEPNPRLGLVDSPFYVNSELIPWPVDEGPRRAAVSSFGLGGTNAHVILEQAPSVPKPDEASGSDPEQLLVLSAKTPEALEAATDRLHEDLRARPELALKDVAFTLRNGRRHFPYRRVLVCADTQEAVSMLDTRDEGRLLSAVAPDTAHRPVAFLFPGFGAQFPGMAAGLYETEEVFRRSVDRCASLLEPLIGQDIRPLMFMTDATGPSETTEAAEASAFRRMLLRPKRSDHLLDQPNPGHAALFSLEYSLFRLWDAWGVQPDYMIGHSLGEYVAACAAGVFSLSDALRFVVRRAHLIEEQGQGAMVAVSLPEVEALRHTADDVCLAAVNGPRTCVLSGTVDGIERVLPELSAAGVIWRRLSSRYAFHSPMMAPVADSCHELLKGVPLSPPSRRLVSNTTGTWITDDEATSPRYWAEHVRNQVRFTDGVGTLWSVPHVAMVEVGPGQSLTTDTLQHPASASLPDRIVVPSLPDTFVGESDRATLLRAAGRLWLAGRETPYPEPEGGTRVPLPTYPFERHRYWLEPDAGPDTAPASSQRHSAMERWFYTPSWKRLPIADAGPASAPATERWLVFIDNDGLGAELASRLSHLSATVRTVTAGDEWADGGGGKYVINPANPADYEKLAAALRAESALPDRIVHCWGVGDDTEHARSVEEVDALLRRTFHSLVHWAQTCAGELTSPMRWDVVTTEVHSVMGDEPLCPPKAALQGVSKVLAQEYPAVRCVHIDLPPTDPESAPDRAEDLLRTLCRDADESILALRGRHVWAPMYSPHPLGAPRATAVRRNGVYLITGGLGRIGLVAAHALAEQEKVRLVLVSRAGLPDRANWDDPALSEKDRGVIRTVRAIEQTGSEVLVMAADVADVEAMRAVKEKLLRVFGPLNGVLHCAGTTGPAAHQDIAELGVDDSWRHFGPKVYGVHVLHEVLSDQRLDFALLFSSLSALVGGLGFGAYASASAVLDAFAQRYHSAAQPWSSVNWESWRFSDEEHGDSGYGTTAAEPALTPEESLRVLNALFSAEPRPRWVMSTTDLERRRALWASPVEDLSAEATVRRHKRPSLRTPCVAPTSETETRLAKVWQELLGVDAVGVDDNFFELGGNSLLGLHVVQRLRQDMAVAVPLTIVYEGPTVRSLAALIDGLKGEK
ncbi:beta-ketoacyl synthase N-terminal-like domain-containing protein [Streptomyces lydicus]